MMIKSWWPRLSLLAILAVIVGVPFVFSERAPETNVEADAKLIIFSPHNEQIRYEISRAFNRWRQSQGLSEVMFDWRSSGGTGDLQRQLESEMTAIGRKALPLLVAIERELAPVVENEKERLTLVETIERNSAAMTDEQWAAYRRELEQIQGGLGAKANAFREAAAASADLFFGGGSFPHNQIAGGIKVEVGGRQWPLHISQRVDMSDEQFEAVFPQAAIGGEALYHDDRLWVGTVLSSFGIVYNRDVLGELGVPEPQTWADLTDPKFDSWIVLADPLHSGSINATYVTILQRMGWVKGWETLRRAFANSSYFSAGAGTVPVDVSKGEAAAGLCIGFYGRYQAGRVPDGRMGYVEPRAMTAITPDPITLLRGAPNKAVANQFIRWLLSREAQRLWQLRRLGHETEEQRAARLAIGITDDQLPLRYEVRRLPIRKDLYTPEEMAHWIDPVNVWEIAHPVPDGTPNWWDVVKIVSHSIAIDNHDYLREAWRTINRETDPQLRAAMLAKFDAMPPALTLRWSDPELAENWHQIMEQSDHPRHGEVAKRMNAFRKSITDPWKRRKDRQLEDQIAWREFFRQQYIEIIEMGSR